MIDAAILDRLYASGLIPAGAEVRADALTGGVASDIWKVEAAGRTVVVKKALAKLRVAADWQVPVSRNAAEARFVGRAIKINH